MAHYNGLRGDQHDPEKVAAFRARSEAIERGKKMAEKPNTQKTLSRGRPPHGTSGPRKDQILALKAQGRTGVQIARELGITPAAVSYHLKKARLDAVYVDGQGQVQDPAAAAEENTDG